MAASSQEVDRINAILRNDPTYMALFAGAGPARPISQMSPAERQAMTARMDAMTRRQAELGITPTEGLTFDTSTGLARPSGTTGLPLPAIAGNVPGGQGPGGIPGINIDFGNGRGEGPTIGTGTGPTFGPGRPPSLEGPRMPPPGGPITGLPPGSTPATFPNPAPAPTPTSTSTNKPKVTTSLPSIASIIAGLIAKYGPDASRWIAALSEGRAQGRAEEAVAANNYDRLNILRNQQMFTRANTEIAQRKFAEELQAAARHNAPRADFLRSSQDVTFSNLPEGVTIPTISGGVRPSAMPNRAAIGTTIYDQAMNELRDPLQPGTATSGRRQADLPVPDPLTQTPGATGFDTALDWTSLILGAAGDVLRPRNQGGTPQPASGGTPGSPVQAAGRRSTRPSFGPVPSISDLIDQQAPSTETPRSPEEYTRLRPRPATAQPRSSIDWPTWYQ